MSCSATPCTQNLTLDPFKRVCYSQGLVLGVDEFVQEELYFLEQHRWHNRGLHGYGTVCGLDVEIRDSAQGPEVFVAPGMAVDPKGRRIRVGAAQCAQLNVWLARFGNTLGSPGPAGSPDTVELFLRLCYRECSTDRVPIPSGPCRSEDETTAASRVLDDFKLELTTTAPDQIEADVVRQFGALLRSIEFSDAGPATLTLEDLEQLVRGLAPNGSPSLSPPLSSPPTGSPAGVWRIDPSDAEEYLRAAFRLWVTEVRPSLLPDGTNCAQGPPDGDCILLARLEFPVNEGATGLVVNGSAEAVTVDEAARPYLLHTQLLQELFLGGASIAEPGTNDHSQLVNLDQDDHQQYLLVAPPTDPARPAQRTLIDSLLGGGNQIKGLAPGTDPGDAMPIGQAAGGDLALTYPNPTVARIQTHPVAATQPTDRQVLQWIGSAAAGQWEPRTLNLQVPPQPTNFEPELVRIFALSWTHHTVHDFFFTLDDEPVRGLAMAFGVREFADARIRIGSDRKRFDLGSFDDFSFEILIEAPAGNGLFNRLRIPAIDIVPIDPGPLIGGQRRFTSGRTRNEPAGTFLLGPAVFVRITPEIEELMTRTEAQRVHVVLTGDHVMDADGKRAIDAEFLRSELSSGDRPVDSEIGLQGGLFRSWFRFGRQGDINRIGRDELIALGVTPAITDRLLALRNNLGGIRDLRVLDDLPGVGPARLAQLRDLLVIRD